MSETSDLDHLRAAYRAINRLERSIQSARESMRQAVGKEALSHLESVFKSASEAQREIAAVGKAKTKRPTARCLLAKTKQSN